MAIIQEDWNGFLNIEAFAFTSEGKPFVCHRHGREKALAGNVVSRIHMNRRQTLFA